LCDAAKKRKRWLRWAKSRSAGRVIVIASSCRTCSGIHREVAAKPLGGSRNKSGMTV
jgi:hypothetical protein